MSLSSVIREQERGDICSRVHLLLTFGDFFMFHIQIRLEDITNCSIGSGPQRGALAVSVVVSQREGSER